MIKKKILSKTLWFNGLTVLLGLVLVVQEWMTQADYSPLGITALLVGLCNFGLRLVTTEALK